MQVNSRGVQVAYKWRASGRTVEADVAADVASQRVHLTLKTLRASPCLSLRTSGPPFPHE